MCLQGEVSILLHWQRYLFSLHVFKVYPCCNKNKNSTPFYDWIIFQCVCVFVIFIWLYPWIHGILWIILLWILMYKYLFESILSILLDLLLAKGLLALYTLRNHIYCSWNHHTIFPQWLYNFTLLSVIPQTPNFPMFNQYCYFPLLNNYHIPGRYEMLFLYCFDLYLSIY